MMVGNVIIAHLHFVSRFDRTVVQGSVFRYKDRGLAKRI